MKKIYKLVFLFGLIFAVAETYLCMMVQAADRDAIWKVVHDQCLLNYHKIGRPDPCVELHSDANKSDGFAVLKDLKGSAHYLIIPTDPVSGIESPELLKPSAANWFALAWRARGFLDHATHRVIPRNEVALALNSVEGRGQDQLHIHVSCILPSVKAEIDEQSKKIGNAWSGQTIVLDGKRYFAERIKYSNLSDFNPIQAVASEIPDAKNEMARMTIIVVGAFGKNERGEFFIFAGRSNKEHDDRGKAEDLLDNNCEHLN